MLLSQKLQGETDAAWGRRLSRMRRDRGFSRAALARSAGITAGHVFEHEYGLRRMKPVEIVRYAKVLGVRLSAFVNPEPVEAVGAQAAALRPLPPSAPLVH